MVCDIEGTIAGGDRKRSRLRSGHGMAGCVSRLFRHGTGKAGVRGTEGEPGCRGQGAGGPRTGGDLEAGETRAMFRGKASLWGGELFEEAVMLAASCRRNVDLALSLPGGARLSDDYKCP